MASIAAQLPARKPASDAAHATVAAPSHAHFHAGALCAVDTVPPRTRSRLACLRSKWARTLRLSASWKGVDLHSHSSS